MAFLLQFLANLVIEILRESLTAKIQKNRSYSSRAFARDIKVSPAFISMVLSGKKKLSLDKAKAVSAALEMPDRKRDYFLKSVALSTLPNTSATFSELENILFGRKQRSDIFPIEVDIENGRVYSRAALFHNTIFDRELRCEITTE